MSVQLKDLLSLPSLKQAELLAGEGGLERIVTSVSVLEYSTPSMIQEDFFSEIEFNGSELVLTGFCSIADDVEAQMETIKRLAYAGEVGIVLYYVGLFVPVVDERVIHLCNSLDFALIQMPKYNKSLRYSEVIQEVNFAVFQDQQNTPSLSMDVLDEMSKLPKNQQTIRTLLRILSDRLRSSLLLTDAKNEMLSAAPWPRNEEISWEGILKTSNEASSTDENSPVFSHSSLRLYKEELLVSFNQKMILLIASEHGELDRIKIQQTVDALRIGLGLWSKDHDRIDMAELVRSILQDEPMKMKRLGSLYRIDVESLSDTWILKSTDKSSLSPYLNTIQTFLSGYVKLELSAPYEDDLILFPLNISSLREHQESANTLAAFLKEKKIPAKLTLCPALQNTRDVKEAYELNTAYLTDTEKIFKTKEVFTIFDLAFTQECRDRIEGGMESVEQTLSVLDPIHKRKEGEEILKTLSVYLLDCSCSISKTADQLFVHKNTVKYRLKKAGDLLGYVVGELPQTKNLMTALAVRRLLSGDSSL